MRLKQLPPEALDAAGTDLYERIAGGKRASGPFRLVEDDGSLTGPFNVMLHAPSVGGALSQLGEAIRYATSLDARTREVAILTVAAVHASSFEWYAHERVARQIGMTEAELTSIRRLEADGLPEEERVVMRLSHDMAAGKPVSEELFTAAEDLLGTERLVELSVLIGYYELLAGVMELFAIGVPAGEPDPLTAGFTHD